MHLSHFVCWLLVQCKFGSTQLFSCQLKSPQLRLLLQAAMAERRWFSLMKFQDTSAPERRSEWLCLEKTGYHPRAHGRCWFFRESMSKWLHLEQFGQWEYKQELGYLQLEEFRCCRQARKHELFFVQPMSLDEAWVPWTNNFNVYFVFSLFLPSSLFVVIVIVI